MKRIHFLLLVLLGCAIVQVLVFVDGFSLAQPNRQTYAVSATGKGSPVQVREPVVIRPYGQTIRGRVVPSSQVIQNPSSISPGRARTRVVAPPDVQSFPSSTQSSNSVCFMTTSSGEIINLEHICGENTEQQLQPTEFVDRLSSIRSQLIERLNNGDIQGGIDGYTQILAYQPNNAETYFTRGVLYWEIDDRQSAITDLQQAAHLYRGQRDEVRYRMVLEQIEEIRRFEQSIE